MGCQLETKKPSLGYVRIQRFIIADDIWQRDTFTHGQALIDLIMLAKYEPTTCHINHKKIELKIGQMIASESFLCERWSWSRGKVRRFLIELQDKHYITRDTVSQEGIITIVDYLKHYGNSANETNQNPPDGTTDGAQVNKIINKNKINTNNSSDETTQNLPDGTTVGTTNGTTDGTTHGTSDGTTPQNTNNPSNNNQLPPEYPVDNCDDGTTVDTTDGTTHGTADGTTDGTQVNKIINKLNNKININNYSARVDPPADKNPVAEHPPAEPSQHPLPEADPSAFARHAYDTHRYVTALTAQLGIVMLTHRDENKARRCIAQCADALLKSKHAKNKTQAFAVIDEVIKYFAWKKTLYPSFEISLEKCFDLNNRYCKFSVALSALKDGQFVEPQNAIAYETEAQRQRRQLQEAIDDDNCEDFENEDDNFSGELYEHELAKVSS